LSVDQRDNKIKLSTHTDNPISESRLTKIQNSVSQHKTLEHIMSWAFQQQPPLIVEDMISQDEFSIDVIVRYDADLYLVYGVT
jgi:hypothetical protein